MEFVEEIRDAAGLHRWMRGSVDALVAHSAKVGDVRVVWYIRYGSDTQGAQVQMWWKTPGSRMGPELLWDYVNLTGEAAAGAQTAVAEALSLNADPSITSTGHAGVIRPRDLGAVPMFAFHPQRFRAIYPSARTVAQAGMRSGGGGFTQEVMNVAANGYMTAQQQALARSRIRRSVAKSGRADMDLIQLSMFYADFHHGGKQIFDFPPEMVEMFLRTDVDGIPLEAIKLPYPSMYLHFGRQDELEIEDGWAPDGAYVSMIGPEGGQVMQFCLTFAPKDHRSYEFFAESPEPCYIQAVNAEQMKVGVGEAVDLVLSERIAKLREEVAQGSPAVREGIEQMSQEMKEHGVRVTDGTHRFAAGELSVLPQRHKAWVTMLRLVVNGLAYLSAYPGDWADQVGSSNAPPPWSITSELNSGNHKRAQKATSKLAELGYTAIHFCGVRLRSMGYGQTRRTDDSGNEQPREAWTWVRGHWKRQAHGPQWSLHRLRWLMPFKRSIDATDADEDGGRGHVYLVS